MYTYKVYSGIIINPDRIGYVIKSRAEPSSFGIRVVQPIATSLQPLHFFLKI